VTLFDPPADPTCFCGSPCKLGMVHRADAACFVWEPPDVDHLGRFQGHSATSRAAAIAVFPHTGTQRARVLGYLLRVVNGATDEELGLALSMNPSSVRPRRIELVTGGWARAMVDDDGVEVERPTKSGASAQVWTATVAARQRQALEAPQRRPEAP
jgi:hypothetical protein